MNYPFRTFLLLSVLIHTILLGIFIPQPKDNDNGDTMPKTKPEVFYVEIVPNEDINKNNVKNDNQPLPDDPTLNTEETKPKQSFNEECKNFYIGIGIISNHYIYEDGRIEVFVIQVHSGYPAHRYGIQEGDILITYEEIKDGGPIGSIVDLTVLRDGRQMQVAIPREKICTK